MGIEQRHRFDTNLNYSGITLPERGMAQSVDGKQILLDMTSTSDPTRVALIRSESQLLKGQDSVLLSQVNGVVNIAMVDAANVLGAEQSAREASFAAARAVLNGLHARSNIDADTLRETYERLDDFSRGFDIITRRTLSLAAVKCNRFERTVEYAQRGDVMVTVIDPNHIKRIRMRKQFGYYENFPTSRGFPVVYSGRGKEQEQVVRQSTGNIFSGRFPEGSIAIVYTDGGSGAVQYAREQIQDTTYGSIVGNMVNYLKNNRFSDDVTITAVAL